MPNQVTLNPSEIISVQNNELKTTSLQVATAFNKRHDNVLRKIKEIAEQTPSCFNALNFEEAVYTDKNGEERAMFNLTKDGFMLVVMGFTGKLAMQIKIAYIDAFNFMADKLYRKEPTLDKLSTVETRVPLKDAVNRLVATKKVPYNVAWKMVHQREGVSKANELTEAQVQDALQYVHELTLSNVIEGELLLKDDTPKLPELPDGHVNILFNMEKNADYMVRVREGKASRKQLLYCLNPQDEKQDWWLEA